MVRGGVTTQRAQGCAHGKVKDCPASHSFARRINARNTPWITSSSEGSKSGYFGFSALRNGLPFFTRNVLSVFFRSINAATICPGRGSGPCSNTAMSPSQMCFPIIESPATRSANVFRVGLNPILATSTEMQPSGSCSRSLENPAGIVPNRGISTMLLRCFANGDVTRSDRALPESDSR